MEKKQLIHSDGVGRILLEDDGRFPNNSRCPLLVYPKAVALSEADAAAPVEELLHRHGWGNSWRNGVFGYHHYHSTAHEVLGVYSGSASVQLGGEEGIVCEVRAGDVVVIPAGVAHKKLESSGDFRVVGAYPDGQSPDMFYGKSEERPRADENISRVPKPTEDPVFGESGPLLKLWE
jgi:uncharacterized protein YjlB